MKFTVEGKEISVPDHLLLEAGKHAETRGMTLEEYIAEAFTMLKKDKEQETVYGEDIIPSYNNGKYQEVKVAKNSWSYDANGSPLDSNKK